MTTSYRKGDATAPQDAGPTVIVHLCNDAGKWGKGFVLAISKRWREPEEAYRSAFASEHVPQLGDVQFVGVTDRITVANLIGQHGVRSLASKAPPPIRYPAIREGLKQVAAFARQHGASVTMPRIGCGLAGGTWDEIEPIIQDTLCAQGISVTVYDFS
jgi:O-acetyl-ADP-ribose deacetylase (regulator of RNase III)